MGLNERRKGKELQETILPGRMKEIEEICQAMNFLDNVSCHRLNMALRVICVDDMGKEAVREGLKLIRLVNVKEPAAMQLAFSDGVLTMSCAYALGAQGMHSDGTIRELLIKSL